MKQSLVHASIDLHHPLPIGAHEFDGQARNPGYTINMVLFAAFTTFLLFFVNQASSSSQLFLKRKVVIATSTLSLRSGLEMTCLLADFKPKLPPNSQPFILFVHGSLHGAWCWAENWMPYLAAKGIPSVAVNLRGTAGTPLPAGAKQITEVKDHLQDLMKAIDHFRSYFGRPVLLVGHSFAGLILMNLMQEPEILALTQPIPPSKTPALAGLALLSSIPPGGNGPMAKRFLSSHPLRTLRVAYGFASGAVMRNVHLAREMFFDEGMAETMVEGYMERFQEDGQCRYHITDSEYPLSSVNASAGGIAGWVGQGKLDPARILVLGGEADVLVDWTALEETAHFCGLLRPVVLQGVAHDLMLDSKGWEKGASVLYDWLQTLK